MTSITPVVNTLPVVNGAILPQSTEPTMAELLAKIASYKAENAALREKKASAGKLSLKVSEKLAVSVYGLGRWPITLYKEQFRRLLAHSDQIEQFIADNESVLKTKEDK